jgi:hypothetical protein
MGDKPFFCRVAVLPVRQDVGDLWPHDKIAREDSRMNVFHKLAMLGCIVVSLAAQSVSANDPRAEGIWKRSSERIDNGSIARLPVGSVMTVTRAGDHVIVGITDERGKVTTSAMPDGGPVKLEGRFSPAAKTLTQTINGTDSHTVRPYSVTRACQKQGVGANR